MKYFVFVLCFILLCAHGDEVDRQKNNKDTPGEQADQPLVSTPSGTIRGSWMTSRRGRQFQAYRGVRYAESPVGELRFQPPKPISHYEKEVDAREEGPACPQPTYTDTYSVDEDCLRLNVYTPAANCSQLLPVVVYIHAGGFYSASGRSDEAGPHYMLDHDMVFVAINYRLGSLGFLSTGDALAPGNNGLKDQVAALRWVQRNIASFCGAPGLVTLAGYSAGSISVALHALSPMSAGLFHRARAMSGSPFTQVSTPHHQYHLAVRQAEVSGCPTHNSSVIIDCLKKVPWRKLGDSLGSMFEFAYDPILIWLPVIEPDFGQERFLTQDPLDSIREGKIHRVPFMVSQTRDEFFWKAFNIIDNTTLLRRMDREWERVAPISFQLPRDASAIAGRLRSAYLPCALRNDSVTATGLGRLYADAVIGFPVHRMVKLLAAYSPQPVFEYVFNYTGNHSFYEDSRDKQPNGVAHHDDLIYLLSLRLLFQDVPADGSADSGMVDKMTAVMYYFAKYGDPNRADEEVPELSRLPWPRVLPDKHAYMSINTRLSVYYNLFEERFNTWEKLFQ